MYDPGCFYCLGRLLVLCVFVNNANPLSASATEKAYSLVITGNGTTAAACEPYSYVSVCARADAYRCI